MNLDAFKTNGSSPPKLDRKPECQAIGCGVRAPNHNPRPDFLIADHGSIFLLQPITDRALVWVREHLSPDSPRFGSSVVLRHDALRHDARRCYAIATFLQRVPGASIVVVSGMR